MGGDPRKETFLGLMKMMFCRGLTIQSFITIITIVDLLTFIVSLIGSGIEYHGISISYFLGPNISLIQKFNKSTYYINGVYNYQIYRLFTPIFLHMGFSHFIMNMIS
jgi:membrane associated rhomboid family serine protease